MSFIRGLFDQAKSSILIKNNVLGSVEQIRTATKRAAGSKTNNKDSAGRRLGPKAHEGHPVKPGQIIMRQRGTVIHPGENVRLGKDHTIYAVEPGYVRFYYDPFHPRRKYVGVALTKDIRFPKDHFAPNLRRFGYVPITDTALAKEAEAEKLRKEELLSPKLEKIQRRKQWVRNNRLKNFKEQVASEYKLDFGEQEMKLAAERLVNILELIENRDPLTAAKMQVTYNKLYDFRLQYRNLELSQEEFENAKQNYMNLAKKVDNAVCVSVDGVLYKSRTEEENEELKKKLLSQLETLYETEAASNEYRSKAQLLVETPGAFDLTEREQLKQQFVPKRLPLDAPGTVIKDIDLKNVPENVVVERIYDEEAGKVRIFGRPKTVFA